MGYQAAFAATVLVLASCAAPSEPGTPAQRQSATIAASPSSVPGYSLVVIGDSIPYAREDCGGCDSFAVIYGGLINDSTGLPVRVANLSTHDSLTAPGLRARIRSHESMRDAVRGADIVVVSIGHNDAPMNTDDPCGGSQPDIDWSLFTEDCIADAAADLRYNLDGILDEVDALRHGRPTRVLVTNTYNDWIGWPQAPQGFEEPTRHVLGVWDETTCEVAEAHDAVCADIYHLFNGPAGEDAAGVLLSGDYIHPSAEGHEQIALLIFDLGLGPLP